MIVAFQTLEQGHVFIMETNSPKNFLMKNGKWIGSTICGEESLQQVFDRPNGNQGQRWIPLRGVRSGLDDPEAAMGLPRRVPFQGDC